MGIYDRDYIRSQPPPGREPGRGVLSGMRMWSVNTWLIVICVAVFVIDGFTGTTPVQIREPFLFDGIPGIPETAVIDGEPRAVSLGVKDAQGRIEPRHLRARPYLERPGGRQIGWVPVMEMNRLAAFMHFSTARGFLKLEVWRFIGFQFLHGSLMHILFNMIGLYFFGPLVENRLGSKRYLAFYLLCGIFGAVMFLLLNLGGYAVQLFSGSNVAIPGLIFDSPYTPLIGASAGVFGVLMAGAYIVPNATVLLFFILPMRLATLAYALVAIALFTVIFRGHNAGGEAGHLGGAIAGFYFIRHPHHLHGFFDFLGWADPTSHHYRHKSPRAGPGRPPADRAEVDRILDKISDTGLHSLSEKEKRILREASNR
ncbi:MAG: rhomboid family intramembrane serine protease [Planctomycetota bacterium]|jgi:membrane associated rhomboid family serine protease